MTVPHRVNHKHRLAYNLHVLSGFKIPAITIPASFYVASDKHNQQHVNDSQPSQTTTPDSYGTPYSNAQDLTPIGSPSPEPQLPQTPRSSRASSSSPATDLSDINSEMTIKCKFRTANGKVCGVDLLDSRTFINAHVKEHASSLPGHISKCPFGRTVKGKKCGQTKESNQGSTLALSFARHLFDLDFYERGARCPTCRKVLSRDDSLLRHIEATHDGAGTTTNLEESNNNPAYTSRKKKQTAAAKKPRLAKKRGM